MLQQHAMLFVATGLLQLAARRWHTVLFVATVLLQLAAGIPCCLLQQSCCNLHVAAGIGMPCCLLQQACCNLPLTYRAICCNLRPVATCRWHAVLFVATGLLQLAAGMPCCPLQQACCNLPLACHAFCCNSPVATCHRHPMPFVATIHEKNGAQGH